MKKAFVILAAFGMIATSAAAQTQRLNRTTTKKPATTTNATNTTVISAEENKKREEAAQQDGTRFPASGATGVDGSINDRANSGSNRSSTITEDHGNSPNAGENTVTPVQQTATPVTR